MKDSQEIDKILNKAPYFETDLAPMAIETPKGSIRLPQIVDSNFCGIDVLLQDIGESFFSNSTTILEYPKSKRGYTSLNFEYDFENNELFYDFTEVKTTTFNLEIALIDEYESISQYTLEIHLSIDQEDEHEQ